MRRFRESCLKRKSIFRDERGVASTVGTIMALMVVLAFLSMIVNQWVPVWMKDAEAGHMSETYGQFGDLKSAIDYQIMTCRVAQYMDEPCAEFPSFVPVSLGVEGMPLFSAPTSGRLVSSADAAPFLLNFTYKYNVSGEMTQFERKAKTTGQITFHSYNRYFVPQTLIYEGGAIIRSQFDGEIVRGRPAFDVRNQGSYVEVSFTMIQLYGSGSVQGVSTEGIHATLIGLESETYENVNSSIGIEHETEYGVAWFRFFNETLAKAYNVTAEDYNTGGSGWNYWYNEGASEGAVNPYFSVKRVKSGNLWNVLVEVKNSQIPISLFTLNIAHIETIVGESGARI